MWCRLIDGKPVGLYSCGGTLNGRRYSIFLTNELPILLDDVSLDTRHRNIFFQRDSVSAHNAIVVRQYVDKMFPNRWCFYDIVSWPARTPNITTFFLCEHVKTVVYADPPVKT